jgi:uncharacterized DUF497 family protein
VLVVKPPGFEWDAGKARSNLRKHGIDFADVPPVFEDDRAVTMPDDLTAVDERRFLTLGCDGRGRVLVVAYTWRGSAIRIVSARKATPRERREYRVRPP